MSFLCKVVFVELMCIRKASKQSQLQPLLLLKDQATVGTTATRSRFKKSAAPRFSTHFSVFRNPHETLFLVFDIQHRQHVYVITPLM